MAHGHDVLHMMEGHSYPTKDLVAMNVSILALLKVWMLPNWSIS